MTSCCWTTALLRACGFTRASLRALSCFNCFGRGSLSLATAGEYVTGASHGLQHLRLGRVLLDLLPDPGDAQIDAAVEHFGIPVMSKLQKLLAAEHPVGMPGKGLEEVELHAGQGNVDTGRVIEAMRSQIEGA